MHDRSVKKYKENIHDCSRTNNSGRKNRNPLISSVSQVTTVDGPPYGTSLLKKLCCENQDGGVGRHTVPPCTTRTERKSNSKEVRHQGDKKRNIHPDW